MSRRLIFLYAVILRACFGGGGTMAWAALTPEEVASARHAYGAAVSNVAAGNIFDPTCLTLILRAQRDTATIPLSLWGGYPEIQAGSTVTRQEQLRKAVDHRARALADTLPTALACVDKQLAKRGTDALRESANQLRLAIAHLELMDPTLPYADPTPQPLLTLTISDGKGGTVSVSQTEPAVVGPHGLYWDAIAQIFWAGHYSLDMMDSVMVLLSRNPDKRRQYQEIVGLYRAIRMWQLDAAARISGTWPEGPVDRFCQILDVFDTLTNGKHSKKPGLPLHYFALMLQIQKAVTDDPVAQRVLQSYADLWLHTDDTNWGAVAENEPLRKRCQ